MFWVSGLNGSVFRGPLEDLLHVERVPELNGIRALLADDADVIALASKSPSGEPERYRAAAAAYRAAVKPAVERGRIYHAYEIMTREVLTLQPQISVADAWRALARRRVGQAPVLDGAGRLLGLVSRENLLQVLNEQDGQLRDVLPVSVQDVMVTPVIGAAPVAELRRITRVMVEYSQPAVPILDESTRLVGIVSRRDILKVVAAEPPLTLWA